MALLFIVAIIVIASSAFASGSEAAIFTVSMSKVRAMAAAGRPGSKALLVSKKNMAQTIGTIVIINNISNIVGSALIGVLAARLFESAALGFFFAAFTLLIIIFAEIIPKTVGEAYAEPIALAVARPVYFMFLVLRPLLRMIEVITYPFHRDGERSPISEEEIKVMAQMGRESGTIEMDESKLIQRVFRLNDITAEDMMTPWALVEAIPGDETLSASREKLLKLRHSRIPVYGESPDVILGVVLLKDLLSALPHDRFAARPTDYVQEPIFVSHDMLADDLLIHFQRKERHLAIVVDENRKLEGVVTLEDVLEELVGEITDEKDVKPDAIKRVSKHEILVDIGTEVSDIDDFFNASIYYDGTIGDYLFEKFGKHMKVGDVFRDDELEYRVISMARTRPERVSVVKRAVKHEA